MRIDKVGIEKEFWLLDLQGRIKEPKVYGFPFDEFGFLVELRTEPYTWERILIEDFNMRLKRLQTKASRLNFVLSDEPRRLIDKLFIKDLSIRYQYSKLKDLTANIYNGTKKSHATGIDGEFGTAGLHVHFSRFDDGKRVQLPIVEIAKEMDRFFYPCIVGASRNRGEYEIKPYGFEYRSLPSNVDIKKVIKIAFRILKGV